MRSSRRDRHSLTTLYDTDRLQGEFKTVRLADGSYFIEHPLPKTTYETLPPVAHNKDASRNKEYPRRELEKHEIEHMRQLRLEQPDYWTQKRLSDKFQVSTIHVAMYAPCPFERKERLNAEHHQKLLSMGYKKKLAWLYRRQRAAALAAI